MRRGTDGIYDNESVMGRMETGVGRGKGEPNSIYQGKEENKNARGKCNTIKS